MVPVRKPVLSHVSDYVRIRKSQGIIPYISEHAYIYVDFISCLKIRDLLVAFLCNIFLGAIA